MSKKFKSQASSSRAAAGGFGAFSGSFGGFSTGAFSQAAAPSSLTYVAEPPDLSRIAEPQLVVAFRNLLKRDDITKAKALEDLRDYILTVESRNGTLDDGFLEAWVCLSCSVIGIWSEVVTSSLFFCRSKYTPVCR